MKYVCILDDDVSFGEILQRRLTKKGFQSDFISDQELPIQSWHKKYDVFLIDLKMGEACGLVWIATLREKYPDSQIIMMTGFASIATAVKAVKLGADDYIPKPFELPMLIQMIQGEQPDVLNEEPLLSPERLEWEQIQRVLDQQGGNISATARLLGMHRRTLQRKLSKKPVRT
ncbi:response regulator transcription factor [Algicola sagamiensis]|uniref:response regulator transcription factor n=1 Tax=Algicola sagamiensis TaxID=163869 RepID=UPI000373DF23|nr:response regulator [Algicola sagamiensis]